MLGRQQIAGIPTAVSELFKNAHDAYADEVTASFLEHEELFVLRDDGHGMSLGEFEAGWLTLGTESKIAARAAPRPADTPSRPLLGEKGIGRLAISVIGPQVLILTRAISPGQQQPLLMSFIHWGMFEVPGIDLDELEIPLVEWPDTDLPGESDVRALVDQLRMNLQRIPLVRAHEGWPRLERELRQFDVNPAQDDGRLPGPTLSANGHGTHFYIKPTDESLSALLSTKADVTSRLQKMLIGFTNTITPDHPTPPLRTHFFHYRSADDLEDVIDEKEFFTPEDFGKVDHAIFGDFDEFGQFVGEISIYGEPPVEHRVAWRPARGVPTFCGPFKITVAYVQGELRQSRLSPEQFGEMNQKLDRAAGLYVYRDGIRVLPYGDNRYDFLDIEERRTRSAKYYFFSYRRLFGAVELDSRRNGNLQEKAGREGFRENAAYRQFRSILENFFVETAADYFREGGDQADVWIDRRATLTREEKARQRREKTMSARRNTFRTSVEETLRWMEEGAPVVEAASAKEIFKRGAVAAAAERDPTRRVEALLDAEEAARDKLREVKEKYTLARPRGIALGKALQRDWKAYQQAHNTLQQELFPQAETELESLIARTVSTSGAELDIRRRLERSIDATASAVRSDVRRASRTATDSVDRLRETVRAAARTAIQSVDEVTTRATSRVASVGVDQPPDVVAEIRLGLENEIEQTGRHNLDVLLRCQERIEAAVASITGGVDELQDVDMEGVIEEELLALRERAELDLELSAIGMAVEVINHEFEANRRGVRSYLRRLQVWSERNPALRIIYQGLTGSFDQLDSYLTLFTPLQRRIYRKAIDIRGSDISAFLSDLFRTRLREDEVSLNATTAFRDVILHGYPSTFYPVFVNLVDNALYWLTQRMPPRIVTLDAEMGDLLVSDNGSGVKQRDRDEIFELGFTRKPGGRGLGLHISRDLLARDGWAIVLEETPGGGATFRLHQEDQKFVEEDA